ncbi:MAG: galactose-1-phosphate uridylyltransferase, partial [Clostridia bacterium]|nr:galactose-1-phosphate uridylyltransferase [Clostridia bacterium]
KSKKYPDALLEVTDWAATVLRIVSKNRNAIEEIGDAIRQKWVDYEDKAKGIVPYDEKGAHNAVSPTVVKTQRGYEMSVILRSNVTSEEFPDGVFHVHPEFHVIKKESIGLIEAQGLFILPGRLENELGALEGLIVRGEPLTAELKDYALVYDEVKALCKGDFSEGNVRLAVRKELGSVCNRILDNIAVFKDKKDTVAFARDLGFESC